MTTKQDKREIRKRLVGNVTVKRIVRAVAFIYFSLLLIAYFFSDRIIFRPHRLSYKDGPEILKIETESGAKISAVYLSEPNSEYTILYSHGNAEDIGDIRKAMEMFADRGFSVLVYDYRGYGTSSGMPSEKNAYKDIEAAYGYLVGQMQCPPSRIIAMGRSVGAAVAMHLACRKKLAGLILEGPFVTAFRVVTYIPLLPFDKFRNVDKIKKAQCPVLVIHGRDDSVVPFWHGEKLFKTANEPKLNLWVDGAGHNDVLTVAGNRYWAVIEDFTSMVRANRKD